MSRCTIGACSGRYQCIIRHSDGLQADQTWLTRLTRPASLILCQNYEPPLPLARGRELTVDWHDLRNIGRNRLIDTCRRMYLVTPHDPEYAICVTLGTTEL